MSDEDKKVAYLQMIQGAIDRMSTSSAVFKGFCATIIAGISAISYTEINKWILLLSVTPIGCFLLLDIYYLRLERRYRILYNEIRVNSKPLNFEMEPPKGKLLKGTNAMVVKCVFSPTIMLFYIPSIFITSVVIGLKFCAVI